MYMQIESLMYIQGCTYLHFEPENKSEHHFISYQDLVVLSAGANSSDGTK